MALVSIAWSVACPAVCYVNANATGANTGASWTDAHVDLQSALTNASCTEIWVAWAVYTPAAASQTTSFVIKPGVAVYGGFAGGETSRAARDPVGNTTVLSGDIDGNDGGGHGIDFDWTQIAGANSRHVVVMDGTAATAVTASTVLDGFTLTGGDNTNSSAEGGGALWCKGSGAGHVCSPTLANLVFIGNKAAIGGAVSLDGHSGGVSNATLSKVVFRANHATNFGGAMYLTAQLNGGTSSPTLTDVVFDGNSSALYGGALFNDGSGGTSSPVLTNVTFSGNQATGGNGGAMVNNGGSSGTSSPVLTNVTFSGNHASNFGGAMYNSGGSGSGVSNPKLVNATFNGNSASKGGAIYNQNVAGPTLLNSILWGDSATSSGAELSSVSGGYTSLHDSILQGGCVVDCGGTSITTTDPKLGALADNGGFTQTIALGVGSAAIDAVACDYVSEAPATDQRGAVRPDPASSGATRCDIGAVEAHSQALDRIFADRFGSGTWDDF